MKPYSANRAVNGSVAPVQRWVSSQVPAWLSVNLQKACWINRWIVRHMGAAGWSSPSYNLKDFKLQGSLDGANWFDLDIVTNNNLSVTDRTFTAIRVAFVRIYVASGININPKLASLMELEVYEAPPTSPYLSGLTLSSGTLEPAFSKNIYSYSATVKNSTSSITITPTAEDSTVSITVNSQAVTSGQSSQAIGLNIGDNTVNVVVSADGNQKMYSINVVRASSPYLTGLSIPGVMFTFNPNTFKYSKTLPSTKTSITFVPTAEDDNANIKIKYTEGGISKEVSVISKQTSPSIPLSVGLNVILIQVTSAIGQDQKTYEFDMTR